MHTYINTVRFLENYLKSMARYAFRWNESAWNGARFSFMSICINECDSEYVFVFEQIQILLNNPISYWMNLFRFWKAKKNTLRNM